jgi:hypothetical protein
LNVIPFAMIASGAGFFIAAILGIMGAIIIVIGGIVLGGTSEFEFPKSKKFVLPKEVASAGIGPEHFVEMREYRTAIETMKKDTG